jgi:hypothetical protein
MNSISSKMDDDLFTAKTYQNQYTVVGKLANRNKTFEKVLLVNDVQKNSQHTVYKIYFF